MPTLAELQVLIQSSGAEKTKRELEDLATSGEKAEKATSSLGNAQKKTSQELDKSAEASKRAASAHDAHAKAGEGAARAGQALGRAIGGEVDALFDLAGALGIAGKAFGVVATVVTASLVALADYEREQARLINTTLGLGRASGFTATQIEEAAKAAARASGQSKAAATDQALAFAAAGVSSAQSLQGLTSVVQQYADLTGQKAPDATRELAAALQDPTRGAAELNAQLGFLNSTQLEHIQTLQAAGEKTQAASVLADALTASVKNSGAATGGLTHDLRTLGAALSDAYGWLKELNGQLQIYQTYGLGAGNIRAQADAQARANAYNFQLNQASVEGAAIVATTPAGMDRARRQQLEAGVSKLSKAAVADAAQGNAAAYMRDVQALSEYKRALDTFLPSAEKAHQLAVIDGQMASTRDKQTRAALAAKREEIRAAGEIVSAETVRQRSADASRAALTKYSAAGVNHAAQLAREAEAARQTTIATLGLAKAYSEGDAQALRAQARVEAVGKAIRSRGDIEAYVQRQLEQNAAKAAADAAKQVATVNAQINSQIFYNDVVADGTKTAAEAAEQMKIDAAIRPFLIQMEVADAETKKVLKDRIDALRISLTDLNQVTREAQILAANEVGRDRLTVLEEELKLIGATNRERAVTLARLEAEQELKRRGAKPGDSGYSEFVDNAGKQAGLGVDLKTGQDAYNLSLTYTLDLLRQIDDQTQAAAQGMASAFGRTGQALGNLATTLTSVAAQQQEISDRRRDYIEALGKDVDPKRLALFDQEAAALQIRTYGDLAASAKGFFKQGSDGYKAMAVAEKAFRAIEFANAIKSMVLDKTVTGSSIANSALRASADGVAAVAKAIASLPFPLNLAAGAATAAALVSFGVKLVGGGGGGSSVPTAEQRQASQGTGTVLGDSSAKSESISRSLELVEAHTNRMLEFQSPMLKALRSIDNNIGLVAASLARQLTGGGAFDTSKLSLGSSSKIPGFIDPLGITSSIPVVGGLVKALFGKTKTTTLADQGLAFDAQTLESILNEGISGSTYQDVATQTKKKFLGITYSNKTKTSTVSGDLDAELATQIGLLIGSLRDSVVAAATALGVEGADATLNAFQVELGKISLKDLKPDEIVDTLNAVFSKLGDEMAGAVVPALQEVQKAGEGLFETLTRVARQYQVIDVTLASVGKTFDFVGLASIGARERLVEFFGSLDDFVEQTAFFAENFLSDIERMAPIQAAVEKELTRLGLAGINTKQAFKDLVLSLDVSTEAGAEMYAALLNLAPAFLKVVDFTVEGSKDLADAKNELSRAYEREASALQNTADKFGAFADNLRKFRLGLDAGPNALLSPEAQYNASKAQFQDVAARARLGDEKALADLQGVSQAYLDASKAYYASSGAYFQDLAAVKAAVEAAEGTASRTASNAEQQLATLKDQAKTLDLIEEHTASFAEALAKYLALQSSAVAGATGNGLPTFTGGTGTGGLERLADSARAGPAGFNAASYGAHYPDVVAAYETYKADMATWAASGFAMNATLDQFLADHYRLAGKAEGRTPFASTGEFTVAGSGPKNFGPVQFHGGEIVSVRRPYQPTNDNSDVVAELKQTNARLAALEQRLAQHGEVTANAQRNGARTVAKAYEKGSSLQRLKAGGAL